MRSCEFLSRPLHTQPPTEQDLEARRQAAEAVGANCLSSYGLIRLWLHAHHDMLIARHDTDLLIGFDPHRRSPSKQQCWDCRLRDVDLWHELDFAGLFLNVGSPCRPRLGRQNLRAVLVEGQPKRP